EFQLLNNTLLNNKLNNTPAISNQIPIQPENKILFFHDNGNYPDLIAEKELDPIIGTDGSDVAGNIIESKFDGITVVEYTAEISDVEECSATVTVYIELHQDTVLTDPLVFDFSIDRLSSNATFVNETNLLTINPGSVSGTINIPISFTIEDETLCGNFELDVYEESGFVGVLFDP